MHFILLEDVYKEEYAYAYPVQVLEDHCYQFNQLRQYRLRGRLRAVQGLCNEFYWNLQASGIRRFRTARRAFSCSQYIKIFKFTEDAGWDDRNEVHLPKSVF